MGTNSGVSWCDYSHGFWYGCRKVSPGCANCYAERQMKRFGLDFDTVTRAKGFSKPLSWKRPGLVFVNPWSDYFHEDADAWRDEAWNIMLRTQHLTYMILTKRPENIAGRLPADWPLKNVWLGVTAENQEMADKRIPILLSTPAALRFVSVEPMIGLVGLDTLRMFPTNECFARPPKIDWVICGGESGPDARMMHERWAIDLKRQCAADGVPFFFKQMSGGMPIPDYLQGQEFPKF